MSNCPVIPQCCQPIYGYNYQQTNFLSAATVLDCPSGSIGGPFTVQAGAFYSDVSQADADSQAQSYLSTLAASGCIVIPIPVVTSATVNVAPNASFSYQIVATHSPTSYGATNLPAGLSINTTTGLITGTITSPDIDTYTVAISATNAGGTGDGTLTINVARVYTINIQNFTFDPGTRAFPQISQISLDGAPLQTLNVNTDYTAISQIKITGLVNPGTYPIAGGVDPAIIAFFGTISGSDGLINITGGLASLNFQVNSINTLQPISYSNPIYYEGTTDEAASGSTVSITNQTIDPLSSFTEQTIDAFLTFMSGETSLGVVNASMEITLNLSSS